MSRQAPTSATSARALQAAAPTPARLTVDSLGQSGSSDALTKLNSAISELKALSAAPMLQRAMDAIRAEDAKGACDWALKALEQDERNGFGWYLLGIALERAGDFASSISAYEAALKLIPDHGEVANDLGRLAFRLGMTSQSEALFRLFLERYPDHPEGSNNLACAIRDQGRHDEAIEILRPAIIKSPEIPMLWNTMGTVVSDQGDFANALVFFEEALRLDPTFPKARYNRGNAKLLLGDAEGAIVDCEAAMSGVLAEDERQMMRLSRSTILLNLGRIGEGWDDYEARLNPQFNDRTDFAVNLPRWAPDADLAGKTLLVVGEQGLGDEVLFGNVLPDVIDRLGPKGRLVLSVEPRLVPLFQRAFPQAQVDAHATYVVGGRLTRVVPPLQAGLQADLWTPMGSLMREFRRSVEAYPTQESYLAADPARVAHWRKALAEAPAGLKIGLLWKSAVAKDARHRYFSPFETWAPVLAQTGVTFVNLQYGDCAEEIEAARRDYGVEIWTPPGIDLKQDLDDVAALCGAMDLIVGFSNATLNIAGACGAPTFLISTPGAWPRLGRETSYPWYPKTRVFLPPGFGQWDAVMADVAKALAGFVAER
ncbi:MAG TPA: tetratricopeptide repeat protein [Phenylobacterium sp.]|jgi:Tfp pilus assembly protein PilF|uniref:tetratricopeptide repeat protein n=1 Tax=Phenylobacterium sp. TaxID=1871053 RepID=UPI002C73B12D|nr:tetratricopeptide repeat protein [Phenylobacterium sp.]HXA38720.1 tetratricopeptide repeat protein [Phenylobacterium sp.]